MFPPYKKATVRATKENARRACELVVKLVRGRPIHETDQDWLLEFMDQTVVKLPTEKAMRIRNSQVKKKI